MLDEAADGHAKSRTSSGTSDAESAQLVTSCADSAGFSRP